jgi:hypothetical protein
MRERMQSQMRSAQMGSPMEINERIGAYCANTPKATVMPTTMPMRNNSSRRACLSMARPPRESYRAVVSDDLGDLEKPPR